MDVCFYFSGYILRRRIVRTDGNSMFIFLFECHVPKAAVPFPSPMDEDTNFSTSLIALVTISLFIIAILVSVT